MYLAIVYYKAIVQNSRTESPIMLVSIMSTELVCYIYHHCAFSYSKEVKKGMC